jgi:tetratricopeptide (TPR) repeat protein
VAEEATQVRVTTELGQVADATQVRLGQIDRGRPARRFGQSIVEAIRRGGSYADAMLGLADTRAELDVLREIVTTAEDELARRHARVVESEPGSETWRLAVRHELATTGQRTAPWLGFFARAFVLGAFDACSWLCTTEQLLGDRSLARQLGRGADAAKDRRLAETISTLETLTESAPAGHLPVDVRIRCWCMRVRAVCHGLPKPARGRQLAERALEEAGATPAETRAALHTALGECLLELGDGDGALSHARSALELGPGEPAGHVLRGLIAERQDSFDRADEWYQDAVEVGDGRAVDGALFAPCPPNLLWKYGRRLRDTDPEAAALTIRAAITQGIRGQGEFPDHKAYLDLARTEEKLDRGKAAESYWEAGRRYAARGDEPSALAFVGKACALAPGEPLYRYERAEALRGKATRPDGTVDLEELVLARDDWRAGYERAIPGRQLSWAYVTGALIAHAESGSVFRPRPSWYAAALLERGVLADPDSPRIRAQLSQAHRLLGNRWTAVALTEELMIDHADDEVVFDQHFLALLELGRYTDALELLEARVGRPDQPWQASRVGEVLLALGRPEAALRVFEDVTDGDPVLHDYQLALCHLMLGDDRAAQVALESLWERETVHGDARPRTYWCGLAAYELGRYDDAEGILQRLLDDNPQDAVLTCGLALVLLARGNGHHGDGGHGDGHHDDVGRGEALLRDGITALRSVYALTHVLEWDLPHLSALVAGRPHGERVRAVADAAGQAVRHRLADLTTPAGARAELTRGSAEGPAAATASLAGRARIATAEGAPEEALRLYIELAGRPGVPEAGFGVDRLARRVRDDGDALAADGDHDGALGRYEWLLGQCGAVKLVDAPLVTTIRLRAALLAARTGPRPVFVGHLTAALPADPDEQARAAVGAAIKAVIRRADELWKVRNACRTVIFGNAWPPPEVAAAKRLMTELRLDGILRSRRADLDSRRAFALVPPLVLRVDGRFRAGRRAWQAIEEHLAGVVERVESDTGVPVPGIGIHELAGAAAGAYRIELYEIPVVSASVRLDAVFAVDGGPRQPFGAGSWVEDGAAHGPWWSPQEYVARHLEAVMRANLPRLFVVDDVGLWLEDGRGSGAGEHLDRLSGADRLELLRLLRLLLREQVPIVDRDSIFDTVTAATPGWSAVDVLPAVRRRLASSLTAGVGPDSRFARVPSDLEGDLVAGVAHREKGVWQLPRDRVEGLTSRLLGWWQAEGQPVVVVTDPRVRTATWRLLAGVAGCPVCVLTEEEVSRDA